MKCDDSLFQMVHKGCGSASMSESCRLALIVAEMRAEGEKSCSGKRMAFCPATQVRIVSSE